MTLTEFLLARIDVEDDVLHDEPWLAEYVHRECEMKRRIVALHTPTAPPVYHCHCGSPLTPEDVRAGCWAHGKQYAQSPRTCDTCASTTLPVGADGAAPCETLAALAIPYAEHEDYREEWRP